VSIVTVPQSINWHIIFLKPKFLVLKNEKCWNLIDSWKFLILWLRMRNLNFRNISQVFQDVFVLVYIFHLSTIETEFFFVVIITQKQQGRTRTTFKNIKKLFPYFFMRKLLKGIQSFRYLKMTFNAISSSKLNGLRMPVLSIFLS